MVNYFVTHFNIALMMTCEEFANSAYSLTILLPAIVYLLCHIPMYFKHYVKTGEWYSSEAPDAFRDWVSFTPNLLLTVMQTLILVAWVIFIMIVCVYMLNWATLSIIGTITLCAIVYVRLAKLLRKREAFIEALKGNTDVD